MSNPAARRRAGWAVPGVALVLAGCSHADQQQSVLNPEGARAEAVSGLWQLMLILGVIVWCLVVVAMVIALLRRRRQTGDAEDPDADENEPGRSRRLLWIVATAGAIIPAAIIVVVAASSTLVLEDINPDDAGDGTVVEVIGHQYWWEVKYPGLGVTTANEIHIPTGEKVRVEVNTGDVIHSFWVPELSGKIDMIPGRTNSIWLKTDNPGTYWGQCAEFCGVEHALMRFVVVAHEPQEFAGWVTAQQQPALFSPAVQEDADIARGREIFMSSSCVYCHTIGGTAAAGDVGPDLTHLASRDTIAAGILPNDRGNLAGWILDPQAIKPGNLMPGTDLSGDDLQALLTYLESLE